MTRQFTVAHTVMNGNTVERVTSKPDWLDIERAYRAGVLSLRAIAAKDGRVSEGAIRKKARKLEWSRDLSPRIRSKAAELVVAATVRTPGPRYATGTEGAETAIVDDHAQVLAHVDITQRRNIARARNIVVALFDELEGTACHRTAPVILDRSEVRHEDGAAHGADATTGNRGLSLSSKAATAKALADALRTLVSMERQAWAMDDRQPVSDSAGRVIDSSKLSWEERQQMRAMIIRVYGDGAPAAEEQSRK